MTGTNPEARQALTTALKSLLTNARIHAGKGSFSQARIAADLNFNAKSLSDWLNGKTIPRDFDNLLALVTRLSRDAGQPVKPDLWRALFDRARSVDATEEPRGSDHVMAPATTDIVARSNADPRGSSVASTEHSINLQAVPRQSPPKPEDHWEHVIGLLAHAQPVAQARDPYQWGVHQSRSSAAGTVVSYVPRDVDDRLRGILAGAAASGGAVLIIGDSTAGKTRTAFEAVRRVLPDRWLVAPNRDENVLAQVVAFARSGIEPGQTVYWLDDLDLYIGAAGVTRDVLLGLIRSGAVVVATLRSERFETYRAISTFSENLDEWQIPVTADRTGSAIDVMERVRIHRLWSDEENMRARRSGDARVQAALAFTGTYGVSEYLAAGPALFEDWQDALAPAGGGHPRGAALVAAAVDIFRCGMQGLLPRTFIEQLHEWYLRDVPGSVPLEPLDQAWMWATSLRHGATSMLKPDLRNPQFVRAFEYLPEELDRTGSRVSKEIMARVATAATMRAATRIGQFAYQRGYRDIAAKLWERAGNVGGGLDALAFLAYLRWEQGDEDAAIAGWRDAARMGSARAMYHLGFRHQERGEDAEAEAWWRRAAEEYPPAVASVGHILQKRGSWDEARQWWYAHAHAGDGHAAFHLAQEYVRVGRFTEVAEWGHRALAAGDADAAMIIALPAVLHGDIDSAIAWLRRAEQNKAVRLLLATLYVHGGKLREAKRLCSELERDGLTAEATAIRDLIECDDYVRTWATMQLLAADVQTQNGNLPPDMVDYFAAMHHLATGELTTAIDLLNAASDTHVPSLMALCVVHADNDELEDLERCARKLIAIGVSDAQSFLASALSAQEKWEEALTCWRAAAAEGQRSAAVNIADALLRLARPGEAEAVLTAAADGDMECAMELGLLLTSQGRPREAIRYYQAAADDYQLATHNIAYLLEGQGEHAEASQWWRRAAQVDATAGESFAYSLLRIGDRSGAVAALRAVADDNAEAARALGVMLLGDGQVEQGEGWLRRAFDSDKRNGVLLGLVVARSRDLDEAVSYACAHPDCGTTSDVHEWLSALIVTAGTGLWARWFTIAAESGSVPAQFACGTFLNWNGDHNEGDRWLRCAADAGDRDAISVVAFQAKAAGQVGLAERLWARAAEAHDSDAMYQLERMLTYQGRADEARRWRRTLSE